MAFAIGTGPAASEAAFKLASAASLSISPQQQGLLDKIKEQVKIISIADSKISKYQGEIDTLDSYYGCKVYGAGRSLNEGFVETFKSQMTQAETSLKNLERLLEPAIQKQLPQLKQQYFQQANRERFEALINERLSKSNY